MRKAIGMRSSPVRRGERRLAWKSKPISTDPLSPRQFNQQRHRTMTRIIQIKSSIEWNCNGDNITISCEKLNMKTVTFYLVSVCNPARVTHQQQLLTILQIESTESDRCEALARFPAGFIRVRNGPISVRLSPDAPGCNRIPRRARDQLFGSPVNFIYIYGHCDAVWTAILGIGDKSKE